MCHLKYTGFIKGFYSPNRPVLDPLPGRTDFLFAEQNLFREQLKVFDNFASKLLLHHPKKRVPT